MRSPLEEDAAGVWLEEAGDDVKESCLPGAVGSYEAGDATFGDGERAVVDGAEAAEGAADAIDDEDGRALSVSRQDWAFLKREYICDRAVVQRRRFPKRRRVVHTRG